MSGEWVRARREEYCGNCWWWVRDSNALSATDEAHGGVTNTGACHVDPPTVVATGLGAAGYYPVTHANRFCKLWEHQWEVEANDDTVVPIKPRHAV